MAKDKVSVTIDRGVLAVADADARAAELNRSELIERALNNDHLRISLENYTTRTVPALAIDAYAEKGLPGQSSRGLVIASGNVVLRRDTGQELYASTDRRGAQGIVARNRPHVGHSGGHL
ncbi:hypothetical protein FHT44_006317 [Mycolicibacterium sp. BK634]|nr:hypothetical protein [Mycolicibacterium sp. BK634]